MGRTIPEKILSQRAGQTLKAGDVAVCDIDLCFCHDGNSAAIIDAFRKLGAPRVFDSARCAMILDHAAPGPSIAVAAAHARMRDFARGCGIPVSDVGRGVCNQIIPEGGAITCGDLAIGAASNTCTLGALNIFAACMGPADLAVALACGKAWFRVPETIRVTVSGRPQPGVGAKDIILRILRQIGSRGAAYKAIEFGGDTIRGMSVDARMTITSMAVEAGAKTGLMEADEKVVAWLKNRSRKVPAPISPDPDARYAASLSLDASSIAPQVAVPHASDSAVDAGTLSGVAIDQAFLGSCTNGRLEDLEIASRIMKGARVHPGVRFIVAPASADVYLRAVKAGLIDILVSAGCAIVSPGCGPCAGSHNGVPADNEVLISTSGRNARGRMGNATAGVYLASPATVAASAIAGRIVDPRIYARRLA